MTGTIRCNKDGTVISEKTRTCPKCGKIQCHIAIYWHEQLFRFYKDVNGIVFSYMSALDQLAAMNREIRAKTFKPELWQSGAIKERKLEQAIDQWLKGKKKMVDQNELSYGTYATYSTRVNKHILHKVYGLGKWDIREIGHNELQEFQDSLPLHLKIKTRREVMHTLHSFLRQSLKRFNLLPPPFPDIIKGKDAKKRIALSVEDQANAIKKIPAIHRDVFEFETETGIRPGETCALKIKDFDFKAKTVCIQRTFTAKRLKDWGDKENHHATIPLTEHAAEIAQRHARGRFPDDWLFIHPRLKRHYTVAFLGVIWDTFADVPVTHYEGTRHSFATQIVANADIYAAKELLRHASLKSTEGYVHLYDENLRIALQKRTNVVNLHKKEKVK